MKHAGIAIKGGWKAKTDKDGKVKLEPVTAYRLNVSAKIAQRKSKKVKVKKPLTKPGQGGDCVTSMGVRK